MQSLGRNLKIARQDKKLSLRRLGEKLGLSHNQIHKYEIGQNQIPEKRFNDLCDALNISKEYFLNITAEKE